MCCDLPPFTSQSKEAARTPLNIGSGQLEQSGVRQWKEETFRNFFIHLFLEKAHVG